MFVRLSTKELGKVSLVNTLESLIDKHASLVHSYVVNLDFHVVVVFGLGRNFLFKSILWRCELTQ